MGYYVADIIGRSEINIGAWDMGVRNVEMWESQMRLDSKTVGTW